MKRRTLPILFAVMTLCSMTLIFINSGMNAEESGDLSRAFTRLLTDIFQKPKSVPNAQSGKQTESPSNDAVSSMAESTAERQSEIDSEKIKTVNRLNTPMRKMAHAIEFIPLGFSLCGLFWSLRVTKSLRGSALYALICGILYAVSDEVHQLFVEGRSCQARDVVVDTLGAMIGILLFMSMAAAYHTHRQS